MKKGISIAGFIIGIIVTLCGAAITVLQVIDLNRNR
jgi:hypothetical protein